ncbi:response regulator transcription factor [Bifidobacterium sp. MA2]|uniref:DNA-binding response regulator MtrA n=1 Tax=Bifidobacterium santillanense TaxID=2809028 RepID=A0ABS5UQ03_9BIFI|nr:MtrAB system response regulator MtrA [Bifidobacterium santillanense]MBT1173017.1 response regulator transcription factor [Bifidobacterium santillanense]
MTQDELRGRTIMIVDDDQALGEMLSIVLENEGFRTVTCLDGLRAVEMFPTVDPDLILLDVMLPGIDGTEVARRIRATSSNVPIIMLTAKSDTVDVVAGLEAGADDYVPKPFKVAELLARIRARFRISDKLAGTASGAGSGVDGANGDGSGRDGQTSGDPNHIERGAIVIDRLAHTATKDGRDLGLTPMEFELLSVLAASAGDAISRSSLLKRVWGYESSGDTRLVNVHVQRLRAKVEDDPEKPSVIVTVRGIGYKFVPPEPHARA